MLIDRFDVPCLAPQLMAFALNRELLIRFVAAYEHAVEEGDNDGLVALWRELADAHRAELGAARWLVPRTTFERLATSVRFAPHVVAAPRGLRTRIDASVERAAVHFVGDGILIPSRWFDVESAYDVLVGRAGRSIASILAIAIETFASALDNLGEPAPETISGPRGSLAPVKDLRFFSEDELREIAPEEANVARDFAGGSRAIELRSNLSSPLPRSADARGLAWIADAVEHARRAIAFEELLHSIVGPFRLSGGPGPFLGPPAASRAFGPEGECLPIFRLDRVDVSVGWRWLADDALSDARRDVENAREPDVRWWGEADWVESANAEVPDGWTSWREVSAGWTKYRDRFAHLLETAERQGEGIVLLPNSRHCDLDGPARPRGVEWGLPAR